MTDQQILILILFSPILLTQSILLFVNAKKRNSYAWFWGIWGLIQFPLPTIFYWFFVIRRHRKRNGKD
ncbi:transcriptional regulator [Virgibacillus flavescens]|uniref:transcriptional regulator n=1 Tax=Virgibacillus flavescens TaxID=1611422 RepID=UPI003D341C58